MRGSLSSVLAALSAMAVGCATQPAPTDPKAVACLQHSRSVAPAQGRKPPLADLTAQASAFAACMTANTFVYDQDAADERLKKFEAKRMFDPWRGDPFEEVQRERQRLRLNPELWRRSAG
jgi:hypothetical protein